MKHKESSVIAKALKVTIRLFLLSALTLLIFGLLLTLLADPTDGTLKFTRGSDFGPWFKWKVLEGGKINEASLPVYQPPITKPTAEEVCKMIAAQNDQLVCLAQVKRDVNFCKQIKSSSDQESCLSQLSSKDLNYCGDINSPNDQASCWTKIALANKDLKICDKINSDNRNFDEKSSCILEFAIENNSIDTCLSLGKQDIQAICLERMAIKNLDSAICSKIPDIAFPSPNRPPGGLLRKGCQREVEDLVILDQAKKSRSLEMCNNLNQGSRYKAESCRSMIISAQAKESKDFRYCLELPTLTEQANCIAMIKNPNACERCREFACCENFPKKQCYQSAALSFKDPSLCKDNRCYLNLALNIAGIEN